MVGLARSTVSTIAGELSEVIVVYMWKECITAHMPVAKKILRKRYSIWKNCGSFHLAGKLWTAATYNQMPTTGRRINKRISQF